MNNIEADKTIDMNSESAVKTILRLGFYFICIHRNRKKIIKQIITKRNF